MPKIERNDPQVKPHIAIEDMAELVADHTLQLVARQVGQAALGDGNDRVALSMSGGKGIDAFLRQNVHRRHGHARSDGYLLDHVEQPALFQVGGGAEHFLAVEHQRHRLAARSELRRLEEAAEWSRRAARRPPPS